MNSSKRRWLDSLRGKLTLAFLSITLLFTLATLASDSGYRELSGSLDDIHQETLPRVLALQEVGLRVPDLLRMADAVKGVSTLGGLEGLKAGVDLTSDNLRAAITRSGTANLQGLVDEIDRDLSVLVEAKRTQIEVARLSRETTAAFGAAAADLAEQLEGDLIIALATGDRADPLRDLRAEILGMATELQNVPVLEGSGLERVERNFEIARRSCIPLLAFLGEGQRRERADSFRQLFLAGSDEQSVFQVRKKSLGAAERVELAVLDGSRLAQALQARAAVLAEELTAEISRSRQNAQDQADGARAIQLLLFFAALLLSGLILLFYVRGRVAKRMEQLSDDMARLSSGDLDVEVRGGGDHELATLASAAEVFRKNARDLEQTLEALEMKNATLNEFAHVASHDLKTPMRAIANLATWIQEDCGDALPGESQMHLKLMTERVEKMESLLEDLLRYSRLGNDESNMEVLELGPLVSGVLDLLHLPPKVSVTVSGADRTIVTIAAPLQLCLRNLIQNAAFHSDQAEPSIRVAIEPVGGDDRMIRVIVEDDGPGIPLDQRQEAFRIFRKLDHGGGGTGMGLALTKRAVELMEGTIAIEQSEPRGARIVVLWPLGDPAKAGRTIRRAHLSGR